MVSLRNCSALLENKLIPFQDQHLAHTFLSPIPPDESPTELASSTSRVFPFIRWDDHLDWPPPSSGGKQQETKAKLNLITNFFPTHWQTGETFLPENLFHLNPALANQHSRRRRVPTSKDELTQQTHSHIHTNSKPSWRRSICFGWLQKAIETKGQNKGLPSLLAPIRKKVAFFVIFTTWNV